MIQRAAETLTSGRPSKLDSFATSQRPSYAIFAHPDRRTDARGVHTRDHFLERDAVECRHIDLCFPDLEIVAIRLSGQSLLCPDIHQRVDCENVRHFGGL